MIHTALDIGGSGMAFTAGDSIGLLPEVRGGYRVVGRRCWTALPQRLWCAFCNGSCPLLICCATDSIDPARPQNDPPLVDALLARLGLEGDAVINVTAAGEGAARGACCT